jgi:hypothetical protein
MIMLPPPLTPPTKGGEFKGKTFLLISENTFSAGVVFAAVFKANQMGVVVGQETSGRIRFGSDPVSIALPNTGLKGSIPVAIYTLPGPINTIKQNYLVLLT